MTKSLIFEGDTQVYLYGQNALIPISLHHNSLSSIIGAESSELIIKENRYLTIQTIKSSPPDSYPEGFLEAFNQPAWAEVYFDPENHALEIELYETSTKGEMPILWMGLLENNLMPAYEVEWEVLKSVDENNIAFCALVKTQSLQQNNQLSFTSFSDEEVSFSK